MSVNGRRSIVLQLSARPFRIEAFVTCDDKRIGHRAVQTQSLDVQFLQNRFLEAVSQSDVLYFQVAGVHDVLGVLQPLARVGTAVGARIVRERIRTVVGVLLINGVDIRSVRINAIAVDDGACRNIIVHCYLLTSTVRVVQILAVEVRGNR